MIPPLKPDAVLAQAEANGLQRAAALFPDELVQAAEAAGARRRSLALLLARWGADAPEQRRLAPETEV